MGTWARLTAVAAVLGTGLAVVSGAAGWGTAHRVLAALVSLLAFGVAAALTSPVVHLAAASVAFASAAVLCLAAFRLQRPAAAPDGDARDYLTLTKPRVMSLLLLTGGAGVFVGASGVPGWDVFAVTMIGLALACGGAGALNHYLDRDIDQLMGERTAKRPVAAGRIAPERALEFGIALSALSFVLLDSLVNLPTALLALAGNLFYVLVYTRWLKRTTPQNIVIGGAAGAFPPLVGWAAVTNRIDLAAIYLFLIVFYWTPPHFWALALLKSRDYGRAGVPMAPLVWGERETKRQMVWYTLILLPLTVLPVALGIFGMIYLVSAVVLGALFLWYVVRVVRARDHGKVAWAAYRFSLLYLALLFAAMAVDHQVGA
jgi:protoheme IX farnesyltransferase